MSGTRNVLASPNAATIRKHRKLPSDVASAPGQVEGEGEEVDLEHGPLLRATSSTAQKEFEFPLSSPKSYSHPLHSHQHAPPPSVTVKVLLTRLLGGNTASVSGLLYSSTSAAVVLLNKHVLASYGYNGSNCLLCFHCMLSVVLVQIIYSAGWSRLEPLKWDLVRLWTPVNLCFVAMLVSSFYALQEIGVGMFTIVKNLSNLFTVVGDYFLYRRTYSWHVWACLAVMVLSVVWGGMTDVRFSTTAYAWQLANCVFTSAYSLCLSGLSERARAHTADKQRMNLLSMVYYNNLLSVPFLLVLACALELPGALTHTALKNSWFLMYATLGGFFGFLISFTSMWFVSNTTATFYSLTGSLNKAVVAAAGMFIFKEPTNMQNISSLVVGLVAGMLLPFAKSRSPS